MKSLLTNRAFVIYACGQAVSIVGNNFFPVAVILAVFQVTQSATSGALVLAAEAVPMVLLTLFGGVIGDRLPRNYVMLAADILRAFSQFVMVALLLQVGTPLWAFMSVQFFYGVGSAFFEPASTGFLPQIVHGDEIKKANAFLGFLSNAGQIAGPLLAGTAIVFGGAPLAVALDASSFLLSAVTLAFIRVPRTLMSFSGKNILGMLKEGFVELRGIPWIVTTVFYIGALVFVFNAPIMSLAPVVAVRHLGGPSTWSLMLTAFGVGSIAGSLAAAKVRSLPLWAAYSGMLGTVPLLILLAIGTSSVFVILATALAGLCISVFSVTWRTRLQTTVRPELLSRVAAYLWLASVAMMPLGLALAGPAASRFGTSLVFLAASLAIVVATSIAIGICLVSRGHNSADPEIVPTIAC